MIRLVISMAAVLSGCASMRPELGSGWDYSYKRVSPDTYSIHVKESRFASTADVENLFKTASKKVVEASHCKDYRIKSYSPYLENAFLGASVPVIDGEIICLR